MGFEIALAAEKKPDFFSRAIMRALGTDYSHALIIVDNSRLFHATEVGFHESPLAEFVTDHIFRHRFDIKPACERYALGWLDGCIGTEYSQSQYLGFIFPILRPLVTNGRARTICSEAVADFIFDCVADKPSMGAADFLSPKDIFDICTKLCQL